MPKLKTSKTASKRFKLTARGTLLRRKATRAHKLSGKPSDRKRAYTKEFPVNATNIKAIKKLLGVK
ncbi:50S ribosomal protein L35 [Candidatus Saccharibacteria bacterium]|nr:50S ribosomal protein L35 [Candidatus Saccharibacteria bacterium]